MSYPWRYLSKIQACYPYLRRDLSLRVSYCIQLESFRDSSNMLLRVFLANLVIFVNANVSYRSLEKNGTVIESPTYSMFLWYYHFNKTNIPVVDLQANQSLFNYCDLNAYTRDGVKGEKKRVQNFEIKIFLPLLLLLPFYESFRHPCSSSH